jgi:uncharacterized protein (TIGR02996 family)
MAKRAASTSVFDLLRQRFATAEARFADLESPPRQLAARSTEEAGRVLHQLLSSPGWAHAASVPHLLAVRQALARGVALLLEAEAGTGSWNFLKAYTGFELICRSLCNHAGPTGLPPDLPSRLETYQLPACPQLSAGDGPLIPTGLDSPSVMGFLGLDSRQLQPLRKWRGDQPADWPGLLRLAPAVAAAVGRGLPVAEAVFGVLVEALAHLAAALLAPLTVEIQRRAAAPAPLHPAQARRQQPARAVPSPVPIEPFLARYPGCERLLYAIAERPEDDEPRLILADWLEENGDGPARARSRFILLQCRQAASLITAEQEALKTQAEALLQRAGQAWREGEPKAPTGWEFGFERGLLECATLYYHNSLPQPPGDLVGKLEQALGAGPWAIRSLRLEYAGDAGWPFAELVRLTDLPALAGLHALSVDMFRVVEGWPVALATSPLLSRLRSLSFRRIEMAGLEGLLVAAGESGIVRLALDGGNNQAAACPQMANLLTLDLSVGWGGTVVPIAESLYLTGLEGLRLGSWLRTAGTRALAASSHLPRLAHLDLRYGHIGIVGAKVLAGGRILSGLLSLGLANSEIKAEGLRALCRSPHLTRLRVLDLNANKLGDAGPKTLAASPLLGQLKFLALGDNGLTDQGIRSLADAPASAGLEELVLSSNPLTDDTAMALAGSPHLRRLRYLDLRETSVTAKGARALARSSALPELTDALFPQGAAERAWRKSAQERS